MPCLCTLRASSGEFVLCPCPAVTQLLSLAPAHGQRMRTQNFSEHFVLFLMTHSTWRDPGEQGHSQGSRLPSVPRCRRPGEHRELGWALADSIRAWEGLLARLWCKTNQPGPGATASIRHWDQNCWAGSLCSSKMDMFKNCLYQLLWAQGQYLESMAMMRILSVNRDSEVFTSISVTFPFPNIFAVNIFFFMKLLFPTTNSLLGCFHTEE